MCSKKTLIVKHGPIFGKVYTVIILLMSYVFMFLLSMSIHNNIMLYVMLVSIPLSVNIIIDVLYKESKELNPALGKVACLLIVDCILLYISQIL